MCGIIGYTGEKNAVPIVLRGLGSLEYRGYDSSGIAVLRDGKIHTVKAKGRLSTVGELLEKRPVFSNCAIGHTRWATHGEPSDRNAHPHTTELVAVVHNGIIENYSKINQKLLDFGYIFESQTDTETAVKLIDFYYKKWNDPVRAIRAATGELKGSFAFGILFRDIPGKIYAVRRDSPLICADSPAGSLIASDIPAILGHTDRYYQLEEDEIAVLSADGIEFLDVNDSPKSKRQIAVEWSMDAAEKSGFDHFMLKEIHDEPKAIEQTVASRFSDGQLDFGISSLAERIRNAGCLHIVACGTAMHAGLIGKSAIEHFARLPVHVEIASEFRYNNPILSPGDIVLLISQSGETADTLAALRLAKSKGIYTLAIVNVVGSSVAREADGVIYTQAGPEIAVASTKAYSVQLTALYLLALYAAGIRSETRPVYTELAYKLSAGVPRAVTEVLQKKDAIRKIAERYSGARDIFFIGRGTDYCLAEEASLKTKEISYIHSEAYPAGELKHGTISLITEGVPVVAIATKASVFEKLISNIKEVKARGARVFLICSENLVPDDLTYDDIFVLPEVSEFFSSIPAATVFQLFAYYISLLKGCDIDKPRNLAKSVTVE